MLIRSKYESIALRESGAFGNTHPFWPTVDAALAARPKRNLGTQYRERNSPYCVMDFPAANLESVVEILVTAGAKRELIYVSEYIPNDTVVLNAEVTLLPSGLYVCGSTSQTDMRTALWKPTHWEGSAGYAVLRHFLDADSYENLCTLLEKYDGGPNTPWPTVVELTVCNRPVGTLGWNTIFWEVRSY